MYSAINGFDLGGAPWNSFTMTYNGEIQEDDMTPWKHKPFEVWYCDPQMIMHNQLGNWEYAEEIDIASKDVHNKDGKQQYSDFISGNWSWQQSVCEIRIHFICVETNYSLNRTK